MNGLSCFSGVGLLDMAFEVAGGTTTGLVEIDDYASKVLKLRFPDVPLHRDVCAVTSNDIDQDVDIVFGGFPCQDLSQAGAKAGLSGERSGLYFEMSRIIRETRCNFVLCENVRGAVNLALDTVCADLEDSGYEVWPYVIPANAFGAPHERYRLVVIGVREDVADTCRKRLQGSQWSRGFAVQGSSPFGATTQRGQVSGHAEELADTRSEGRERGSGLPDAEERVHRECASAGRGKEPRPNWPTITVNGNNNRKGISKKAGDGLATAARNWPTLRAGGLCGGTGNYNAVRSVFDKDTTRAFTSNNGGQLNPEWCEIFLGAPMGWTDLSVPNEELQYLGFPMGMGLEQHDWEPPRLLERGVKVPFKKERIRCLGNAVVPDQFVAFFRAIKYMNDLLKGEGGQ